MGSPGVGPLRCARSAAGSTHFYNDALVDHFGSGKNTRRPARRAFGCCLGCSPHRALCHPRPLLHRTGFAPEEWSQRYYVDTTFWGGEGYPIFLYIGGEGPQVRR